MAKKQKPVKLNQQQRTAAEIKGLRERNANLVQQALALQAKQRYYNIRREIEERKFRVIADQSIDGNRVHAAIRTDSSTLDVAVEAVTNTGQVIRAEEWTPLKDLGLTTVEQSRTEGLVGFIVGLGVTALITIGVVLIF